jgi:hypothetical protein
LGYHLAALHWLSAPDERSAGAIEDIVNNILGVLARPPTNLAISEPPATARRKNLLLVWGIAGILIVVAALVFDLWRNNRRNSIPPVGQNDRVADPVMLAVSESRGKPGTPEPQLAFAIAARQKGQDFAFLENGGNLRSGSGKSSAEDDQFVLSAQTTTGGYLYIFQVDSSDNVAWLFPKNPHCQYSSGENPLKPMAAVQLPSTETRRAFILDQTTGTEHFYAVLTTTPWRELEDALANPHRRKVMPLPSANEPLEGFRGIGGTAEIEMRPDVAAYGGQGSLVLGSLPYSGQQGVVVIHRWFNHLAR